MSINANTNANGNLITFESPMNGYAPDNYDMEKGTPSDHPLPTQRKKKAQGQTVTAVNKNSEVRTVTMVKTPP